MQSVSLVRSSPSELTWWSVQMYGLHKHPQNRWLKRSKPSWQRPPHWTGVLVSAISTISEDMAHLELFLRRMVHRRHWVVYTWWCILLLNQDRVWLNQVDLEVERTQQIVLEKYQLLNIMAWIMLMLHLLDQWTCLQFGDCSEYWEN